MDNWNYQLQLNSLTTAEYLTFPDSFDEYTKAVLYMLQIKDDFIYEDDLIETFKEDQFVKPLVAGGMQVMEAIKSTLPDRFFNAGTRKARYGEQILPVWYDTWRENYVITPKHAFYDLFLTYKLRNTDLLGLDNFLDYISEVYGGDIRAFIRFLKLTLRKHADKLLQPEHIETINEWISEREKEASLSDTAELKTKGKPKRERDDKITILNQEQTALLIYCLRETKIIMKDEFLNNKEAGQAFSMLTGYSADSIRQNLNKSEMTRIATVKNVKAVIRALGDLQLFIDEKVKPEE